jgi:cytochrome c oxidase subunit 2
MSETVNPADEDGARRIERLGRRWATLMAVIILLLTVMAVFAGLYHVAMPQAHVETADPRTLHMSGEFIESNLGTAVEPDGSVTVRAIAQQYSFTPDCVLLPTDTRVTFRMTSADVVHGLLITDTNVNLMLIPGYISTTNARFNAPGERHMPCQEFCSVGHEGMWAKVKIIDKATFARMAADHRRLNCVE